MKHITCTTTICW